jgi:hypothetical protein
MRDHHQQKYIVVGFEDSARGTMYQIERTSDRAVCAAHGRFVLDDGAAIERVPSPRQWFNGASAGAYLRTIEDSTAGSTEGDTSVEWIVPGHWAATLTPPPGVEPGCVDPDYC